MHDRRNLVQDGCLTSEINKVIVGFRRCVKPCWDGCGSVFTHSVVGPRRPGLLSASVGEYIEDATLGKETYCGNARFI